MTKFNDLKVAKLGELKVGDVLIVDGGFDCMKEGDDKAVCVDAHGDLYVNCKCGCHYLSGQLPFDGNSDELVGLRLKGEGK